MHEQSGNFFRDRDERSSELRGGASRDPARILIVDPVVGSRFALAKVVAQPGVLAETASSASEAWARLARGGVSLVLVEEDLGSDVRGIDFLIDVRASHPSVRRALVVGDGGPGLARDALARAGLAFVLAKPWNPAFLRSAIRDSIGSDLEFAGWDHRAPVPIRPRPAHGPGSFGDDVDRRLDLLARGLLAGLNSCETEGEVFELLHAELAGSLESQRWIWLDEDRGLVTRIVDDWPLESGIRLDALTASDRSLLEAARRSTRVTRVDRARSSSSRSEQASTCIGFALKEGGRRVITALVFVKPARGGAMLTLLREIQSGLQLAVRRIRDAEARALSARRLARRVSEELRTPVGALSHAIDRLRGEAVRAGMSTEWVDRVSSESARLVRAVELFEDEIGTEAGERPVAAN
ncbi:hypothetical protein K2X89_00505 [Myxococcota bacterium]|nr:hypothetical protein [Myxococcota bacterium]